METKSTKHAAKLLNSSALCRPLMILGAASVLFGANSAQALDPGALPQDPNVVGGKATFSQGKNTLNVNQSSNRAVIDWRSFNIGSSAQTNFNQPGTSSIAVNRVNGSADPTQIEGGLHANGQVWILNPNGVFFGKTAHVDAAGIVATTANINDKAFMAGSNTLQMTGADHGSVSNAGNITVGQAGLAAFVAPSVSNSGTINATVGKVALAAGTTYTLDLAGDHLVELGLGGVNAVVDNSGKIVNPGGTIALTAKAAGQVVNSVVNVSGVVSASSVTKSGGSIVLGGDNVTTTSTAQVTADAGTNGNGGTITAVANNQGTYAGTLSAKGGSVSGDGGKIETSGKSVHVDPTAKISASATNGNAGTWLLDPLNVTISTGADNGTGDTTGATVTTGTIDSLLAAGTGVDITTSQTGLDAGDLTLAGSINTSVASNARLTLEGRHLSATGGSTINITGGALTLDVNTVNTEVDTTGESTNWISDALGMVGTVSGGTTINLGAASYAGGAQIHASGVTLNGLPGAKILSLANGVDGVEVFGNNDTIEHLEFAGPADQSYLTYNWGSTVTRGIVIENGAQNFSISANNIHGERNDILVDGRNTGTIAGNIIDNSKSGISVQYTDGTAYDKSIDPSGTTVINITANSQGQYGNEWGINYHLNGYWNNVPGDESHPSPNPVSNGIYLANAPTAALQQAMLAQSANNGGMTIQDQAYKTSNRTAVTVATTGTATNQGSPLNALNTIQAGIDAVVSGGTVNVLNGTYTTAAGTYINVTKSLTLDGQSEAGVIIDARNGTTYGLRVSGPNSDVTLENFTLYGTSIYGLKAENTSDLVLTNITSRGAGKSEFDLNGILGGTLTNLTADGAAVSNVADNTTTAGNGIGITDSQNVTLTDVLTKNNAWGGLALYQTNSPSGYPYQETGITVDGSNTFTEANGIYAQDQSASNNFGTINLSGQNIQYIAQDATGNADGNYTWFQTTQAGAITIAANSETLSGATVQGYSGASVAGNNTFYVGTSGANAMSIQTAINAASSDATINVLPGTYTGALSINTADLTLQSTGGAAATTIDAGGAAKAVTVSTTAGLGTITVDGFTVKDWTSGGIVQSYVGWSPTSAALDVTNNIVDGPDTGATANGNGIQVSGDGSVVSGNQVNNVHLLSTTWSGSGILVVDGSNISVTNNTVNGADNGIAVTNWDNPAGMSGISITGNHISNAGADQGDGISVQSAEGEFFGTPSGSISGLTITNNSVTDSYSGLGVWDYSTGHTGNLSTTLGTVSGNTFSGNTYQVSTDFTGADVTPLLANNTFGTSVVNTSDTTTIYGKLQTAIDKSISGDTLDVGAGTYDETLDITHNVDIVGAGVGNTIIQPTALLDTHTGHKYTSDMKTTVFVNGASDVNISGVTIDGNDLGNDAVVFWNNSSGSITNSLIENARIFDGAQTGQALAVDATTGNTSTLALDDVTFQNWNKNAIDAETGDGTGTGGGNINLTVTGSSFTGAGPTGTIAQNGIVLWEQGGGTINATIDDDSFSQLSYTDPSSATAAGVLVYGSPNGTTTVKNSTFDSSVQEYISVAGGSRNVDATNNNTFGGVTVSGTTSLSDLYTIENSIADGTSSDGDGLVRLVAGNVYVTALNGSIQGGIDGATAGDTVHVQAGTYDTTLDITKNIDIEGAGQGLTIIQPTALLDTGVGHKYTSDMKTTVFVNGASNVTLNGLTIDGNDLGNDAVVFWNNSSGSITNSLIENARIFDGAQTGQALAVDATGGNTSTLALNDVAFQNWNKNAIDAETGDGAGNNGGNINLTVTGSSFTGAGPTGTIAQNGIVLWEQGGGTINATIDGDSFSQLFYTDPANATAAGVLVYGSPTGTTTVKNSTFDNSVQEYIAVAGGSHGVDATNNNTFGGVTVSAATSLNDLYAIEDKLIDGMTDTSEGLVRLVAGNVYVTAANGSIQNGITEASAGDTVNVQAGSYTLAGELDITKSLSLIGAGAGTIITSNSTGYGINVTADNTTLSSFTFNAPTAHTGTTYGIKVTPDTNAASDRLLNFDINNVAINGGWRTGLDLNGVLGATIDHVTVSNVQNGNGIALTDSANVTLTSDMTTNNAWGGLALYQTNNFYNQQLNNITIDRTNTFNETNGIYEEDQSASLNMGNVSIAGYDFVAADNTSVPTDTYMFFQKTQQNALDFATDATLNGGHLGLANTFVEGWTGNALSNVFTVGTGTGGDQLTIAAALNAASANGTIDVLSGTYAEDVTDSKQLAFNFGDVGVTSFTLNAGADGSSLTGNLSATGAITSNVADSLSGTFTGGSIALNGATTLAGDTTLDATGSVTTASVDGAHALTVKAATASLGNLGATTRLGAFSDNAATTLTGTTYDAASLDFDGALTLASDVTLDGTTSVTTGSVDGAHALTVKAATASLGNLGATTRLGAVTDTAATTLTGGTYDAASLNFGGALTLTSDTTLDSTTSVTTGSVDGAHALAIKAATASLGNLGATTRLGAFSDNAATTLTGTTYDADSLNFGGALTLANDVTLDGTTSVTTASVDGANALTINAKTASLGNLGATTRLGAVTDNAATTLTGTTYDAASLNFGGALTLTDDTTLDATGSLTTGSVDGAHALAVKATTASLGNLGATTRLGAFSDNAATTLTGTTYDADSLNFGGALTLASDVTLDGTTSVTTGSVDGAHALTINAATASLGNLGATTRLGAVTDNAATTLTGTTYDAASLNFAGALTLTADTTLDATTSVTTASVDGANALTINAKTASLGNLGATTRLGAVTDNAATTLTGTTYDAASLNFGGALTLTGDTTLDATTSVTTASVDGANALTINAKTASLGNLGATTRLGAVKDNATTTLTGSTYDAASLNFAGATTLTADTTLDATTSVTTGSVDGAHALTVNAATASLGNLGATTALGAVTDNAATTLTGDTYNAASLNFGGDVTLVSDTTTLDTSKAAGDIVFGGDIFGTTDGGQSLVLIAGSGTGQASANGDISLQNAGTTGVRLDNLTVSGNDFTALTVDLAGDYNSTLTGNQVFAADTLNVGGSANSNVAGNSSGHVVAQGDVNFNVGGNLSGTIVGQNVNVQSGSVTNADITGSQSIGLQSGAVSTTTLTAPNVNVTADTIDATVTASGTADINANTITGSYSGTNVGLLASNNVNANVTATNFIVTAPSGSVTGTWANLESDGSGTLNINGENNVGIRNANPNQLVVEGFVLPAGSSISASGQLILPEGVVLGLLSPGGDKKPKVILVHDVRQLGELLAAGYTAIVIDVTGRTKSLPTKLALN